MVLDDFVEPVVLGLLGDLLAHEELVESGVLDLLVETVALEST